MRTAPAVGGIAVHDQRPTLALTTWPEEVLTRHIVCRGDVLLD